MLWWWPMTCKPIYPLVYVWNYLYMHLMGHRSTNLAKTKIPWINSFLTFSFFPTPQAVWNHCKILPEVADGFSGWASGKSSRSTPIKMSSYMFAWIINSKKKFIWVELLDNLVKWRYLIIFNMQNNGSSIWWCETFVLEEMMRLQDTSTNLQTSLTTGLEKYANELIILGKR